MTDVDARTIRERAWGLVCVDLWDLLLHTVLVVGCFVLISLDTGPWILIVIPFVVVGEFVGSVVPWWRHLASAPDDILPRLYGEELDRRIAECRPGGRRHPITASVIVAVGAAAILVTGLPPIAILALGIVVLGESVLAATVGVARLRRARDALTQIPDAAPAG